MIANDIFEELQHHLSKSNLTPLDLSRIKELVNLQVKLEIEARSFEEISDE